MKKINFRNIGILFTVLVLLNSCDKWIDPEINVSPNSPADVTMNLLLPSSQAGIAYVYGGDHSRMSGMWMQHLSGVDRQSFALERYSMLDSDGNNLWNTLYGGVLKNLIIMLDKAEENDAPYYGATARILTAYTLGILTDVWGDIPYSDALRGEGGNLTPVFDTQEQIYTTMETLLNEAITMFSEPSPVGSPVPGGDDLFFGGNAGNWIKVAKAMKVRNALHLSKLNGYAPVRDLINAGGLLESNDDNLVFEFTTNANEWNPRYQFDSERGDIRVGAKIVDMMNDTEDPRLPVYFMSANDSIFVAVGSGPGAANVDASWIGPGFASQNSPVPFLTYYEQKFMEAEAFVDTDAGRAAEAYNEAVKASLAFHGVSDEVWEAAYAAETAASITLETVMLGKYVAMFMHSETWVDWRRTGIPSLEVPPAAVSEIPRRYLYTTDEKNYNEANVPTGLSSTSRVWWDAQ